MHRFLPMLILLFPPSIIGLNEASAKGSGGGATDLYRKLKKAGWDRPPELSASYHVGDVYSKATNAPVAYKDDCFAATPRQNEYTAMEIVKAMKAGASGLGVARTESSASQHHSYTNPITREIADMHLQLLPNCKSSLAGRTDVSKLFVITAVLKAEVSVQTERSVDGSGGALVAGAGGSAKRQSKIQSEDRVVVAYKTKPLSELLSATPAMASSQSYSSHSSPQASVAAQNSSISSAAYQSGLGGNAVQGLQSLIDEPAVSDTNNQRKSGREANPLAQIDNECLRDAIVSETNRVGSSEANRSMTQWAINISNRNFSELEFWSDALATCPNYCARIMVQLLSCYTDAGSRRIKGLFVFDTGVRHYQPVTRGDQASNWRRFNNADTLDRVLTRMRSNPSAHVLLEGRASRVGNDASNWGLSQHRSDNIRALLIQHGIPDHKIHYRWVGEGEPYFRRALARKFNVENWYDHLGEQTLNQSVTVYVYVPQRG